MTNRLVTLSALAGVMGMLAAGPALARDQLKIVGSSTVYPYAQAVAEEFARTTGYKAPVLESTGSGGGMKIFCQGVGAAHPDITNASRAMKKSEWELCAGNGVKGITEVLIGYDGLSLSVSRKGPDMNLAKEQIFLALASEVPQDGKLVKNPNKKWSDIDPSLPDIEITVYGPPPTSGTRDAFVELAMHAGCEELDYFKKHEDQVREKCSPMRQDGAFIEAGENDNLIVQRLEADPNAVGIFGYSFLYENQDRLKAVKVGGVTPTFETIGDGSYGVSRPLYFYIKNAHRGVIPGMNEYIGEFVSEAAMGPDGYLNERGLVPLDEARREEVRQAAVNGSDMTRFTN